jgi:hypothetical protein
VNLLRFILSNPQNPPFPFSYPVTMQAAMTQIGVSFILARQK